MLPSVTTSSNCETKETKMKINPNDPWYPVTNHDSAYAKLGVTIRLHLAEAAMKGLCANPAMYHISASEQGHMALLDADALIEQANRDEGSDDGK